MADEQDKGAEQGAAAPEKPAAPKPAAPKAKDVQEELADSLDKLIARARAAGVRPLQLMVAAYAKQGLDILDGLLAALEEGAEKKGKGKKK